MKLILSLVILSMTAMAYNPDEISVTTDEYGVTETVMPVEQPESQFYINLNILESGKSFRYMKNPCAGVKGYRLQRTRGFGFENGYVKYFQLNGQLSVEKTKYASFAQFMTKRKLCAPANKKVPVVTIDVSTLQIW